MNTKLNTKEVDQCQLLLSVFESQLNATRQAIISNAETLGVSFEKLFNLVNELQAIDGSDDSVLKSKSSSMQEEIFSCITSLQLNDAVSQRIEHLSAGIAQIRELIGDNNACDSTQAWLSLRNHIRESYTVAEEKEVFDRVLQDLDLVTNNQVCCREG